MGGLFSRLLRQPERRGVTLSPELWRSVAAASTASGVQVTANAALSISAVYACVRVLAESVASLPLFVYRRQVGGGKDRAIDHALYSILHDQPNSEMTSFVFRETMMVHLLLWGNAYAQIVPNGIHISLWPLHPARMHVDRDASGNLRYVYYQGDVIDAGGWNPNELVFAPEQVLHIPGLSFNGIVGLSPIAYHRQALGLALAAEEYGARFFGNDSTPNGILKLKSGRLTAEQRDILRAEWQRLHGRAGANSVAIMDADLDWQSVQMPNEDAQFLQTRSFQVEEVARIFRVPLYMIQHETKDTSWGTGIEQLGVSYVTYSLRPWLVRWEQELNRKLFGPIERGRYFCEFLVDGLLRGDAKSRSEALHIQLQDGIINADEWREIENMNPQPNGQGKVYYLNGNMVPKAPAPREEE